MYVVNTLNVSTSFDEAGFILECSCEHDFSRKSILRGDRFANARTMIEMRWRSTATIIAYFVLQTLHTYVTRAHSQPRH